MAEEVTPAIPENAQEQLAKVSSMFSGGVMNPLAKEQVRIEAPPLPKISIPPAPEMPGSQIPKLSGNYTGNIDTPVKYANALKNHMENAGTFAKDQYKYGKDYSYDADYTGLNFQRYYNAPRVYKEVGFSPWRDNEKIYNEKMTWWDSFKRSSGQAGHLFGTGFSSMLPWNAWDGDDTDEKSAKDMERAHAIGADNRGGVGAFANNLMLDSGYTMGIGAEFAAEEIGIWAASTAAAPFTAGTSWAAAGAETALQVGKISKLLKNFGTFGKGLGKLSEGLQALKSADKARDVYNYVKSGKPITELMKVLTPGTAAFGVETYNLAKAAKTANTGERIFNLARASKGVGAFYRDSREIAAVLSESKLEGGSTELEMRKKLTDSFFEKNGRMPNADEYQQIDQHAYDAGRETYLWNLPALWISNKIVFDKAFKGIPGVQTFRKELSEGLAGKLAFDQAAAKAGTDAWKAVETGMKADAKALFQMGKTPTKLLRHTVGKFATYTNKNLTEALQEQYQDAVSASMKEYHTARFEHPGRSAMHESWGDIFAHNLGKQFTTAQGWETFASGFLMGSIVQMPQHLVYDVAPKKFYQITDPKGYQAFKQQQLERTDRVVSALNAATKDPQRFFNPNISNAVSQGIMNEEATSAAVDGNTKQFKDINDEAMFDHFHTLLQTDKLGLITDMMKDMKSLSGEELEQAYGKVEPTDGEAKAFYNKKIDSMLERAEQIERRSKYVEDRYGNPFNPHKYSPGKDMEKFLQESSHWQGWEAAKKAAVFSDHAFDRAVERMKSITDDMTTNIPVANAPAHEFTVLLDVKQATNEMTTLRAEISAMKNMPGTKRESAQKEKKLEALEGYMTALSRYRIVLNEHAKADNITDLQKEDMTDTLKSLHGALGKYTKVIANINDSHVFTTRVDSAFTKIKDFYHLKSDSTTMAEAINKLENPDFFTMYAERSAGIHKQLHAERLELYRKSYEGKLDSDDFNQLLNQIFELGAYLYPDDNKAFREKGIIPTNFYDVTTGDLVPRNSEKYSKILDLIEAYENSRTKPAKNIPEAEGESGYDLSHRNKINDDKRTYDDLAKEFGFSPTEAITEVPTIDVLNTIIASKHATYREKALARRFLTLLKPGEVVTFVNNSSKPGYFSGDLSKGGVTTIDARYTSEDFGEKLPIEFLILHELGHRFTVEALVSNKDPQFKAAITELMNIASGYQTTDKPLYGMKNELEFVTEALNNDVFRQFLKGITYETTGKSTWEEFVDSVRKFFARALGIKYDNTMLDEAMYIITAKIDKDNPIDGGVETAGATEAQGKVKITPQTPLATIEQEAPDLIKRLIQGYKDKNRRLYESAAADEEASDLLMTPDALTMTDTEIKKHPSFTETFMKLPGAAEKIMNEYNVETGRTLEPQIIKGKATTTAQAPPRTLNRQMRQDLVNLGYEDTAINRMGFVEAKRLIDNKLKPGSEAAAKIKAQADLEREKQEKRKQTFKDIAKSLEAVNSISSLEQFETKMGEMMATGEFTEAGIISDEIIALIDAKKSELKVTYDSVEKGMAIRNKKYGTMVILAKNADSIKVTKFGEVGGKIYTILKDNIPNEFDFMEGMDFKPVEASDIENDHIKKTKETRDKVLDDEEERKRLEEEAKGKKDDDLMDFGDNCIIK
jgi:hypothetical protein